MEALTKLLRTNFLEAPRRQNTFQVDYIFKCQILNHKKGWPVFIPKMEVIF